MSAESVRAELDAYRAETELLRKEVAAQTLAIGRINSWGEGVVARLERVDLHFARWDLRYDQILGRLERLDTDLTAVAAAVFDIRRRLDDGSGE